MSLAVPSRRPPAAPPAGSPATKRARHSADSPRTSHHPLRKALATGGAAIRTPTASTNGTSAGRRSTVNDALAVVGKGGEQSSSQEIIAISSDSESLSDSEVISDDEDEDGNEVKDGEQEGATTERHGTEEEERKQAEAKDDDAFPTQFALIAVPQAEDTRMINGGDDEEEDDVAAVAVRDAAPSFGELLQATAAEPIDVETAFVDPLQESRALAPTASKQALSAPSATSLGTVLTQALRTNDKELLESCFLLNDLSSVRSTIERLPSPLVGNLLQKLADRLHKRPGRAGNLMVWVQWTLVSHGGYLASQRDVVKRLNVLNRVIRERAGGLQPLLTLKGKLDMLSAQLELRKSMQRGGPTDDEDDERIIYVEGEESSSDYEEDEEQDEVLKELPPPSRPKKLNLGLDFGEFDSGDASDKGDDMPTTMNGTGRSDEEAESDEDEDEDLLDDEAEETENDTGNEETDSDEIDDELEESGEDVAETDEDEDSDQAPPAKRSTAARSGFGRRK